VDVIWMAVAAGSAVGGLLRHLLTEFATRTVGGGFPLGTLAVNVLGSAAIGMSAAAIAHGWPSPWSPGVRHALVTGALGGFTTLSAFSMQTLALLQQGQVLPAAINVAASVGLGIAACWAGFSGLLALAR
jgi:CrcB protein